MARTEYHIRSYLLVTVTDGRISLRFGDFQKLPQINAPYWVYKSVLKANPKTGLFLVQNVAFVPWALFV